MEPFLKRHQTEKPMRLPMADDIQDVLVILRSMILMKTHLQKVNRTELTDYSFHTNSDFHINTNIFFSVKTLKKLQVSFHWSRVSCLLHGLWTQRCGQMRVRIGVSRVCVRGPTWFEGQVWNGSMVMKQTWWTTECVPNWRKLVSGIEARAVGCLRTRDFWRQACTLVKLRWSKERGMSWELPGEVIGHRVAYMYGDVCEKKLIELNTSKK